MRNQTNSGTLETLLRDKAKAGDPEFQFRVGHCYGYSCQGIETDYDEAAKWYRLAAEQGHARAQSELGQLLQLGQGVNKDLKEAVRWYRASQEKEDAIALFCLADLYKDGTGVDIGISLDYKEAIKLYMRSAQQGCWISSSRLGDMYRDGIGEKQDLKIAKDYYEQALLNADSFEDFPIDENEKNLLQERITAVNLELEKARIKAETAQKAQRTQVFISYAHKDEQYRDELHPHLKALENITEIKWWDDTKIKSGEDWDKEINAALAKAKVAVLMSSAHFFASEYVWRKEFPHILEAADKDGATILWLPVRSCAYEDTGIDKYQAIIDPRHALAKNCPAERDEIYTKLARRIKELFKIQLET